jgi:hypothetical protein
VGPLQDPCTSPRRDRSATAPGCKAPARPAGDHRGMLGEVGHIARSVEELLEGVGRREVFVNPDGRSSSAFERVWIDGAPHIVKYIHPDDDFTMRVSGDIGHRSVRAWSDGMLDAAPDLVDHAIVGAAAGIGRNGWGSALLMRDVSEELLPQGDSRLAADEHLAFLDNLAGFCAASWGWRDHRTAPAYLPYPARWGWFGRAALAGEAALGFPERIPSVAAEGWRRFERRVEADVVAAVERLRDDVTPLADALRRTPSCFLHGDVKSSNTGRATDGRTVLIDWAYVGEGPACHEIAWHLALDRDRLSMSKDDTAAAFRAALERRGVDTASWWDHQYELCLLGAVVQFGWEKAFGDDEELQWWCTAARRGMRLL